jgi:divalent metal cation (Fe/Co/Zn/Cd) transporter
VRLQTGHELPEELEPVWRRARRLEIITFVYMASAAAVVFLVLGASQAMKAAFIEDLLSMIPPLAFLIAGRYRHRRPDAAYPFGRHRATEVAYLVSAVALLGLGLYLLFDSVHTLALAEHPPIGLVELGDTQIWLGWLMLAALLYTGIPPVVLGRLKQPLAAQLHDKVLHADAEMNRADWMTAGAAMLGIIGIGSGLWWADAVAAIVIALDIVKDGASYTRAATADLTDGRPTTFDEGDVHPLVGEVRRAVAGWDWIEQAAVRMRESGHILDVEVLAVPLEEAGVLAHVEAAIEQLEALDWKVRDVVVAAVASLEDVPQELLVSRRR